MTKHKTVAEALAYRRKELLRDLYEHRTEEPRVLKIAQELKKISERTS